MKSAKIETPIGSMQAIADDSALLLLEFIDCKDLELEISRLEKEMQTAIIPGENTIIKQIKAELGQYFSGNITKFKTPIKLLGTSFQRKVWEQLQFIPMGETKTYLDIAKCIQQPKAVRAVGRANGCNQLAIIIPCHRVINSSGALGGYAGGIERKQWLLEHENK